VGRSKIHYLFRDDHGVKYIPVESEMVVSKVPEGDIAEDRSTVSSVATSGSTKLARAIPRFRISLKPNKWTRQVRTAFRKTNRKTETSRDEEALAPKEEHSVDVIAVVAGETETVADAKETNGGEIECQIGGVPCIDDRDASEESRIEATEVRCQKNEKEGMQTFVEMTREGSKNRVRFSATDQLLLHDELFQVPSKDSRVLEQVHSVDETQERHQTLQNVQSVESEPISDLIPPENFPDDSLPASSRNQLDDKQTPESPNTGEQDRDEHMLPVATSVVAIALPEVISRISGTLSRLVPDLSYFSEPSSKTTADGAVLFGNHSSRNAVDSSISGDCHSAHDGPEIKETENLEDSRDVTESTRLKIPEASYELGVRLANACLLGDHEQYDASKSMKGNAEGSEPNQHRTCSDLKSDAAHHILAEAVGSSSKPIDRAALHRGYYKRVFEALLSRGDRSAMKKDVIRQARNVLHELEETLEHTLDPKHRGYIGMEWNDGDDEDSEAPTVDGVVTTTGIENALFSIEEAPDVRSFDEVPIITTELQSKESSPFSQRGLESNGLFWDECKFSSFDMKRDGIDRESLIKLYREFNEGTDYDDMSGIESLDASDVESLLDFLVEDPSFESSRMDSSFDGSTSSRSLSRKSTNKTRRRKKRRPTSHTRAPMRYDDDSTANTSFAQSIGSTGSYSQHGCPKQVSSHSYFDSASMEKSPDPVIRSEEVSSSDTLGFEEGQRSTNHSNEKGQNSERTYKSILRKSTKTMPPHSTRTESDDEGPRTITSQKPMHLRSPISPGDQHQAAFETDGASAAGSVSCSSMPTNSRPVRYDDASSYCSASTRDGGDNNDGRCAERTTNDNAETKRSQRRGDDDSSAASELWLSLW